MGSKTQGKVASPLPRPRVPCKTQGNTLGSLLGSRGQWDLARRCGCGLAEPGHPQPPVPRLGLSRAGCGEAAAWGRSRGAARAGATPLPRPGIIGLRLLLLLLFHLLLQEPSVVRWQRPPLPPSSGLSDAANKLGRGQPRGPKGGCPTGGGSRNRWGVGCSRARLVREGPSQGDLWDHPVWTLWPASP